MEFPKFVDWIGQRLHDLLHGEGSRSAPQPALVPAAPASQPDRRRRPRSKDEGDRQQTPIDAKLFSYGPSYGSPQGYGPPPKSGGGSSVAIVIGLVLVILLGGGVVVCGGIGFYFVRAGKQIQMEAEMRQAMNEVQAETASPFAPPSMSAPSMSAAPMGESAMPGAAPFQGMPQLDLSPSTGYSPAAPTREPLGDIVTDEASIAVGDKLLAEWGGQWWRVEVLETQADGKVKIHYEGWSAAHDEVVTRSKLRKRSE